MPDDSRRSTDGHEAFTGHPHERLSERVGWEHDELGFATAELKVAWDIQMPMPGKQQISEFGGSLTRRYKFRRHAVKLFND